jgi:hypothetical protein
MHRFRPHRPSPAMAVALLSLVVATGGTGYAASNLPRNSVGTQQIKRNAVVSSKVKKDTLTGDDVNESRLGPVPTAGRAGSAGDADQLGGSPANAFVRSGTKVTDAGHADTAAHADTADTATNATNATNAASATNATNATNAGTPTRSTTRTQATSSEPVPPRAGTSQARSRTCLSPAGASMRQR